MARKRAATASVAAIVAGTAAGTLGLTASPALADTSTSVSCTVSGSEQPFDVQVDITGSISGSNLHPGDKASITGVSVTANVTSELAGVLAAALPPGTTDITVAGSYHLHVLAGSDGLDAPTGDETLSPAITSTTLGAGGVSLGSGTVSGTKQFDVGPADASFLFVTDGLDASLELSGTSAPDETGGTTPVSQALDVTCTPTADDDSVVIDAADVTAVPDNGGGTNPGGNGDNGGKDDNNGHQNTGGNNNTGNNTGNDNTGGDNNTGTNDTNPQGRSNLANTGASNVVPLTATGGALVLLGGGLLVFMRRRRTAGAPAAAAEGTTDVES